MTDATELTSDQAIVNARAWLKENPQPRPSVEELQDWMSDSSCETPDGCLVEPDGWCPHGIASWMLVMGMI